MTAPATSPKTLRRHSVSKGAGDQSEFAGPRDHRAVSKQWRDMTWSWLEPDGAALRLRRLCRQGRVLLCVRACPKAPAMPPMWPETASDEASTGSRGGVGDCRRSPGKLTPCHPKMTQISRRCTTAVDLREPLQDALRFPLPKKFLRGRCEQLASGRR